MDLTVSCNLLAVSYKRIFVKKMTTKESKPLRAAATVIVARPIANNGSNYEIFMLRRSSKAAFVPDMYVFPGGSLDAADYSPETLGQTYGLNAGQAATSLRDEPQVGAWTAQLPLSEAQKVGLYVAALRELFEEAGVLLAVDADLKQPLDLEQPELRRKFSALRTQLLGNELNFTQMLQQAGALLDLSRLTYFSHWITPVSEPRRFDTYFFLATAPANQSAEADLYETTEGVWITPADALSRHAAGNFGLIYPTIQHLKRLAARPELPTLQEYARTKGVVSAMPETFLDAQGVMHFELLPEIAERW